MSNQRHIKKGKPEIQSLISLIRPRIVPYVVGILGQSILGAALNILVAFAQKYMVDAPLKGQISLLVKAGLIIVISVLLLVIIWPFLDYIYKKSIKQVMADFRKKVFGHIQKLPMSYFENHHSGDIVSRLNNDMQAVESIYSEQIRQLSLILLLGLGSIVFMFIIEWRVSLLFLLIGTALFSINVKLAGPIRKLSDVIQNHLGLVTERLTDLLSGFYIMKMYKIEDVINGFVERENSIVTQSSVQRARKNALLDSTNHMLVMTTFAGVLSVGAILVFNNMAEFGDLIAIIQLQLYVTQAYIGIGGFISTLQMSQAGIRRIDELLEEPVELSAYQVARTESKEDMIGFEDVVFRYNGHNRVLNKLSFAVRQGEIAAFVGPSGGGKTTIIKLLLGFYPPESGRISVAGKGLGEYSLEELRRLTSYVSQDAILYDVSISENIRYGFPVASERQIVNAAKAANAHDFIMDLPDGYNTKVGEGGAKLSGGQRQRISIARAIVKDAPVLLLDEATSALDSENEYHVQQALRVLMKNRTVIVIAHRLSTIKNADVIYVIDGGCVVEQGKHNELIDKGGVYSLLNSTQTKFKHNVL
jgi:ATP-binding cassette subfamily B protein